MSQSLLTRLRRDDQGFGLVLVLGMGAILTALMVVSTTAALRALESSREHVSFESALAVADGAVDTGLARAQRTYVATGADGYFTPSLTDPTCASAPVVWPFTTQPTAVQERTWARGRLEAIAAMSGCLKTTKNGQHVTLKPIGRQTVYTLGWSPRRGAKEVKQRLIKAEYLFTPYAPMHAILTSGNLVLDSSTTVTSAPPNSPSLAAVHTNGTITVGGGNPSVSGPVTQSSENPTATSNNFAMNASNTVTGAARENIPYEGARAVWARNHLSNPLGGWYDLCPDGTVRSPTGAAPCDLASPVIADVSATGTSFRGWSYNGAGTVKVWSAGSDIKLNGFSGTYYVSEADVVNPASNTGPPVPNLTVLASSVAPGTCNKTAGNISWGSTDPAAPSVPNTFLVADQDLLTSSNYKAGSAGGGTVRSGFFIAGDQMSMSTSSAGAYGAVIAVDQCDPADGLSLVDSNIIKNPSIYYDPNAQAPFTDIINNTLWLEYPN